MPDGPAAPPKGGGAGGGGGLRGLLAMPDDPVTSAPEGPDLGALAKQFVTFARGSRLPQTVSAPQHIRDLLDQAKAADPSGQRFLQAVQEQTKAQPYTGWQGRVWKNRIARAAGQATVGMARNLGHFPYMIPGVGTEAEKQRDLLYSQAIQAMAGAEPTDYPKDPLAEAIRQPGQPRPMQSPTIGPMAQAVERIGGRPLPAVEDMPAQTARQLPPMIATGAASGLPAAAGFWATQIGPQREMEFAAELGPGHAKEARYGALISSVPEAAIEVMLGKLGSGKAAESMLGRAWELPFKKMVSAVLVLSLIHI